MEDTPQSTTAWLIQEGLISSIRPETIPQIIGNWHEICLDTETTGDFTDLFDRRIVMLQLGCGNTQVVLDTRKEDPTALLKSIKDSNKRILGHNLKYDYQVIKTNYDVTLENL